jgi:IclR family transcriptional regulator, KDG regulon repressor
MATSVGRRNPAHCTAVGKAMMAYLPHAQVESIIRKHGMRAITAHTITSLIELKKEFDAIRGRGYSVDNEEIEEGVRCVGCVVRNFSGEPVAAISISGPAFRLTPKKVPVVAIAVMAAANGLSEDLGFKEARSASGDIVANATVEA